MKTTEVFEEIKNIAEWNGIYSNKFEELTIELLEKFAKEISRDTRHACAENILKKVRINEFITCDRAYQIIMNTEGEQWEHHK